MINLKDIAKGHILEVFNLEEDLSNVRMNICKKCPLYTISELLGPLCNSKLYLNVDTNKTSELPREGYKNGCGCRLEAKTRLKDNHCPLNKW